MERDCASPLVPADVLAAVVAETVQPLLVVDSAGGIVCANPAARRLLKCEAALPEALSHYLVESDVCVEGEQLSAAFAAKTLWLRARDGGLPTVACAFACRQIDDASGAKFLILAGPILSAARAVGDERPHTTDPLTGLDDRRSLVAALQGLMADADAKGRAGFGLLFLDLDHFKTINDRFGHLAGDAALCEIARRLKAAVRPHDLVVRYGGDEFVILLGAVGRLADAATVAERVVGHLRAPIELAAGSVSLSASLGIALFGAGDAPEGVLARADAAMYRAKARGGNGWAE